MARRKTQPESVRLKSSLAERLKEVRTHLFGERGGPEMARRLGLPVRTWYNYESGVTVPAEVALKFIEMTRVDPVWLLRGTGAPFRQANGVLPPPLPGPVPNPISAADTNHAVCDLLKAALDRLESRPSPPRQPVEPLPAMPPWQLNTAPRKSGVDGNGVHHHDDSAPPSSRPITEEEKARFLAHGDCRYLVVQGEAMSPIVADGAVVAYDEKAESLEALDGHLVVARVEGALLVRWLQVSGKYAILRAQNTDADHGINLVERPAGDLDHGVRRVRWITTPH